MSTLPTTMFSPRSLYVDQTCGALMRSTPHSTVFGVCSRVPRASGGTLKTTSGMIFATSGRSASAWRTVLPPVTRIAFRIQKDLNGTWCCARYALSDCCVRSAVAVSVS